MRRSDLWEGPVKALVLIGPTGSGKSTIEDLWLGLKLPGLEKWISHTTRPKRGTEVHGVDYYFETVVGFCALEANGWLVESAKAQAGYSYGKSAEPLKKVMNDPQGRLVGTINYEGAEALMRKLPVGLICFQFLQIDEVVAEERYRKRLERDGDPFNAADLAARLAKVKIENAWAEEATNRGLIVLDGRPSAAEVFASSQAAICW